MIRVNFYFLLSLEICGEFPLCERHIFFLLSYRIIKTSNSDLNNVARTKQQCPKYRDYWLSVAPAGRFVPAFWNHNLRLGRERDLPAHTGELSCMQHIQILLEVRDNTEHQRRNKISTGKIAESLLPGSNETVDSVEYTQLCRPVAATLQVEICTNICSSETFKQRPYQSLAAASGMHQSDLGMRFSTGAPKVSCSLQLTGCHLSHKTAVNPV